MATQAPPTLRPHGERARFHARARTTSDMSEDCGEAGGAEFSARKIRSQPLALGRPQRPILGHVDAELDVQVALLGRVSSAGHTLADDLHHVVRPRDGVEAQLDPPAIQVRERTLEA
mmetsp:Transcript_32126/g.54865  ORF Transcript_32126/g.54865 Transcript_32126/m.54865 type:complete len:117 (+) Transcript_32126:25-375(+)